MYKMVTSIGTEVGQWCVMRESGLCELLLICMQSSSDIDFSSDQAHINANSGRYYMAAVTPLFFTVRLLFLSGR